VNLTFDIFQGIGIACAVGMRPFLPALAAGALAAGDIQIQFKGTDYAFLQKWPFLVGMAAGAVLLVALEHRLPARAVRVIVAGSVVAVAGLFFAGSLCRGHAVIWPGYVGGAVCGAVGVAATGPLVARARARLESQAAALTAYVEVAAVLVAVLSVVAPPIGVIALAGLVWLLLSEWRRGEQKFAGLRILR
jgi:hypothetical protein